MKNSDLVQRPGPILPNPNPKTFMEEVINNRFLSNREEVLKIDVINNQLESIFNIVDGIYFLKHSPGDIERCKFIMHSVIDATISYLQKIKMTYPDVSIDKCKSCKWYRDEFSFMSALGSTGAGFTAYDICVYPTKDTDQICYFNDPSNCEFFEEGGGKNLNYRVIKRFIKETKDHLNELKKLKKERKKYDQILKTFVNDIDVEVSVLQDPMNTIDRDELKKDIENFIRERYEKDNGLNLKVDFSVIVCRKKMSDPEQIKILNEFLNEIIGEDYTGIRYKLENKLEQKINNRIIAIDRDIKIKKKNLKKRN